MLVEKGLVDPAALDALIDTCEHKVGTLRQLSTASAKACIDRFDSTNAAALWKKSKEMAGESILTASDNS